MTMCWCYVGMQGSKVLDNRLVLTLYMYVLQYVQVSGKRLQTLPSHPTFWEPQSLS